MPTHFLLLWIINPHMVRNHLQNPVIVMDWVLKDERDTPLPAFHTSELICGYRIMKYYDILFFEFFITPFDKLTKTGQEPGLVLFLKCLQLLTLLYLYWTIIKKPTGNRICCSLMTRAWNYSNLVSSKIKWKYSNPSGDIDEVNGSHAVEWATSGYYISLPIQYI